MSINLNDHGIAVKGSFALFWGGVFSNWYKSKFVVDDIEYNCVEQYMMAQKAITFKDARSLEKIMRTKDPKVQKALGRDVAGYNDITWQKIKYPIVRNGLYHKFDQNLHQQIVLLETFDLIIVEASPYDNQWGVAMGTTDPDITNPALWKGNNLLGLALMDVRTIFAKALDD